MSDSTDQKKLRKQLFVDPKVQGVLIGRAVLYWVTCLVTITLLLLCWRIVTGPARMFYVHLDDMWFSYGPAVIASFILLPLVVIDVVRLSNRFAGPLLRLRRSMRQLAQGEDVEPLEFRDDDFWHEMADAFNGVLKRVQAQDAPGSVDYDDEPKQEPEPVMAGVE